MPAESLSSLAVLVTLLTGANLLPGEIVQFDRTAISSGELWRLWTGQFCHWSVPHLVGNLAGLAALGMIAGRGLWRWLVGLLLAAPLLSLLLLGLVPDLQYYRGLSGLLAVLVIGTAVEGGRSGGIIALAWAAKLLFDAVSGAHSPLLPDGIATAWQAHWAGMGLGIMMATYFHHFPNRTSA